MKSQQNSFQLIVLAMMMIFIQSAHALTHFPAGKCELQGVLAQKAGKFELVVNPGSNGETRFLLDGKVSGTAGFEGKKVIAILTLPKPVFSIHGVAQLVKIKGLVNPYREMKSYDSEDDTKAACEQ